MSFRGLRRAIVEANHTPVAIDDRRAVPLVMAGMAIARGERVSDVQMADALAVVASDDDIAKARARAEVLAAPMFVPGPKGTKTAIMSFRGVVTYDVEFQPYAVSTRHFAATVNALAADDTVKSIVIMMDSPGGTVFGLPEAADAVYAARQKKKVVAAVDILCASAAYYVASQASEISAMPSGAGVGSIGVRMMHIDCSKMLEAAGMSVTHIHSGEYKVEGNSFQPLSDAAKSRYQFECDTLYNEFLATVARGRGTTIDNVRENFGKGRVLMPVEAKRVGMIDRLEAPELALRRAGVAVVAAEDESPAVEAEADNTAPAVVETTTEPTEEMVNQELTSSDQVDMAAAADLDRRRRLLDLASY